MMGREQGVRGTESFATGQHTITYRFQIHEVMVTLTLSLSKGKRNPSLHFFAWRKEIRAYCPALIVIGAEILPAWASLEVEAALDFGSSLLF